MKNNKNFAEQTENSAKKLFQSLKLKEDTLKDMNNEITQSEAEENAFDGALLKRLRNAFNLVKIKTKDKNLDPSDAIDDAVEQAKRCEDFRAGKILLKNIKVFLSDNYTSGVILSSVNKFSEELINIPEGTRLEIWFCDETGKKNSLLFPYEIKNQIVEGIVQDVTPTHSIGINIRCMPTKLAYQVIISYGTKDEIESEVVRQRHEDMSHNNSYNEKTKSAPAMMKSAAAVGGLPINKKTSDRFGGDGLIRINLLRQAVTVMIVAAVIVFLGLNFGGEIFPPEINRGSIPVPADCFDSAHIKDEKTDVQESLNEQKIIPAGYINDKSKGVTKLKNNKEKGKSKVKDNMQNEKNSFDLEVVIPPPVEYTTAAYPLPDGQNLQNNTSAKENGDSSCSEEPNAGPFQN